MVPASTQNPYLVTAFTSSHPSQNLGPDSRGWGRRESQPEMVGTAGHYVTGASAGTGERQGARSHKWTKPSHLVDKTILLGLSSFLIKNTCHCLKISNFPSKSGFLETLDLLLATVPWGAGVPSSLSKAPCSRSSTCFPGFWHLTGPQKHWGLEIPASSSQWRDPCLCCSITQWRGRGREAFTGPCPMGLGRD